jgi:pyruvate/2-oxoglutarate dehydrogenase complex dihydrolipoamide dehydrogenase (E3) component
VSFVRFQTSPGYYAIGDVTPGQSLAHVASAEGINCVENCWNTCRPIDYGNVPGCTYASPEIASVGLTENKQKKLKLVNFRSLHREKRLLEHQMVL